MIFIYSLSDFLVYCPAFIISGLRAVDHFFLFGSVRSDIKIVATILDGPGQPEIIIFNVLPHLTLMAFGDTVLTSSYFKHYMTIQYEFDFGDFLVIAALLRLMKIYW